MTDRTSPETETLLHCPFCGGKADLSFEHSTSHPDWWKVTCVECGCRTVTNTTSKAKAIERWNTRGLAAFQDLPVEADPLEQWIDRNFSGHGRTLRPLQEPPIDGEPFMSMEDAKQLLRAGIAIFSAGHVSTSPESPETETVPSANDMVECVAAAIYSDEDPEAWGEYLRIAAKYYESDEFHQQEIAEIRAKARRAIEAMRGHAPCLDFWRPIETAPKDGKRITLYQEGRGTFEGWWHISWPHPEAYWMDDADSEPAPTHWMPLLAPPQSPNSSPVRTKADQ